jgi:hypothetical protein
VSTLIRRLFVDSLDGRGRLLADLRDAIAAERTLERQKQKQRSASTP